MLKHLARCAAFAAFVAMCLITAADASLQLSIDTGSGFVIKSTVASGTTASFIGSQDSVDFRLVAGTSNSPGIPPQATRGISSLDITNNSGATLTVGVLVGDTDFAFPGVGPVTITSSLGGTVTSSVVGTVTYQVWIDDTNTQDSMSGITAGLLSMDASGIANGDPLSTLSGVVNGTISATPYSFTGLVTVELSPGAAVNFASTAVAVVPEPVSLLIWSGLACSTVLIRRRHRS